MALTQTEAQVLPNIFIISIHASCHLPEQMDVLSDQASEREAGDMALYGL